MHAENCSGIMNNYIYRINYYVQKREFECIPSRAFLLTQLTDLFIFVFIKKNCSGVTYTYSY